MLTPPVESDAAGGPLNSPGTADGPLKSPDTAGGPLKTPGLRRASKRPSPPPPTPPPAAASKEASRLTPTVGATTAGMRGVAAAAEGEASNRNPPGPPTVEAPAAPPAVSLADKGAAGAAGPEAVPPAKLKPNPGTLVGEREVDPAVGLDASTTAGGGAKLPTEKPPPPAMAAAGAGGKPSGWVAPGRVHGAERDGVARALPPPRWCCRKRGNRADLEPGPQKRGRTACSTRTSRPGPVETEQ